MVCNKTTSFASICGNQVHSVLSISTLLESIKSYEYSAKHPNYRSYRENGLQISTKVERCSNVFERVIMTTTKTNAVGRCAYGDVLVEICSWRESVVKAFTAEL